MTLYAALPPNWLRDEDASVRPIQTTSLDEIYDLNEKGYNCYWYPNYPTNPSPWVKAGEVDKFEYVFVDMDLKDGVYASKEEFITIVCTSTFLPTDIIDSGNGVHLYYKVCDLDAMSFLLLSRRLMRKFGTDPAVCQLKQLMRLSNTVNTKVKSDFKECKLLEHNDVEYTCEELDSVLPQATLEDKQYCETHYNSAYAIHEIVNVDDKLPSKFGKLLRESKEAKEIFSGEVSDRSESDFRLGHILLANAYTKDEAMSVLVNVPKALSRAPSHRIAYAQNIVDKIWTFEEKPKGLSVGLSRSVKDILASPVDVLEGTRFPCWKYLDDTEYGLRLGHVVGLIAGVGVGKTSVALNMFMGFVKLNPSFTHFFCSLEQSPEEIAKRWRKMCGDNAFLYDKVHIIGNYNEDGSFRHLSLGEIKDYILEFQAETGQKAGAVVIDHLGILKMKDSDGENQRIVDLCHELKPFALETNTLLVIQSQAPREKAGVGDLEINKDGAYGSMMFESYMDMLISVWQPLKRCYNEGAPFVTAYKFCKIRHKNAKRDKTKEDVCYKLVYDPDTEHFRSLTQDEEKSFTFFLKKATDKRKLDRKTELVEYVSLGGVKNESKT